MAVFLWGRVCEKAVVKCKTYRECSVQNGRFKMLLSVRVDVIICEGRVLTENKRLLAIESKSLLPELDKHTLFEESRYSVAFKDLKLRDSFNESLAKLVSHKAFEKIYKKYLTE